MLYDICFKKFLFHLSYCKICFSVSDFECIWLLCSHIILIMSNIDVLVQERRNSIADALELRLSCTNPSAWSYEIFQRFKG